MKTPEELESVLAQFYGSENLYRYNFGLTLTDGVKFLADEAGNGAYWLMDVIGSYQPQCRKDAMLRDFQLWTLKVDTVKHMGVVTCERDTDDVAITQVIEYTDFPLGEIRLYVENNVVMLTTER